MGQTAKRTTTVTVDLGEPKASWLVWCQQRGVTPSHELRQALRQAMDRHATLAGPLRKRVIPR